MRSRRVGYRNLVLECKVPLYYLRLKGKLIGDAFSLLIDHLKIASANAYLTQTRLLESSPRFYCRL